MNENDPDPTTDEFRELYLRPEAENETWAKVEIMGHDVLYGRVVDSPWLDRGIRILALPAGDPDVQKDLVPVDHGEQSIFSIQPIPEDEARKLSRRDHYDGTVLDRSEQKHLIENRLELSQARRMLRDEGHDVLEQEQVTELADGVGQLIARVNATIEKIESEGIVRPNTDDLNEIADDLSRLVRDSPIIPRHALDEQDADFNYYDGYDGIEEQFPNQW